MSSDRIFESAVYFEPTNIRIWMFLSMIPDRGKLIDAIQSLHDRGLVIFLKNSNTFVVVQAAREQRLRDLIWTRRDEPFLKRTISFLKTVKPIYFNHFASVFQYAKRYPKLLGGLGTLPGRMLRGMIDAKKYTAADACGREWTDRLEIDLHDCHWTVLHLRSRHGLALLNKGKITEAKDMLVDVYRKTTNVFGCREVYDILSVMGEVFIRSDKSDDNLRRIVFNSKTVADCKDWLDHSMWFEYVRMINSFGLNKEGASILQEIINFRRRTIGPKDEKINDLMFAKAMILTSMSRFSDSLKILRKVYTIRANKFGILDLKTLEIKIIRGVVLIKQGKLEEALKLFKQVEERSRVAFGDRHEFCLTAKRKIVQIYQLQGNFVEALEHCDGIDEQHVATYGKVHRKCFFLKKRMGEILYELKKTHQALKIFKELLEDFENSYKLEKDMQSLRLKTERIESSVFTSGWGTLHRCAERGDLIAVANLIDFGWDVDGQDSAGMTPLHYASAFGQIDAARLLLRKGANYAAVAKDGSTPQHVTRVPEMLQLLKTAHDFFKSVQENDKDLFNETAQKEPCVWEAKCPKGETPLVKAAILGLEDRVKDLLDLGADPNATGSYYPLIGFTGTPLAAAAHYGQLNIVKLFVKRGALRDRRNWTVLHAAASGGHLEVVKYLLAEGAVYCARDSAQQMPRQKAEDPAIKSLLRLVEGLFQDTKKGKVKGVVARLEEMEEGEVAAVSGARNAELRTLVQVAYRQDHSELMMSLIERFKTV